MPEFKFFSIEEVKEFVASLKGTRGGKGGKDEGEGTANANPSNPGAQQQTAPPPMMPPQAQGGFSAPNFGGGPAPTMQQAQPGVDPAVADKVQRINAVIDRSVASGQPTDQMLAWFRTQCGPEAANADLNAIKTVFLFKTPLPTLEQIAKFVNA